MKEIQKKSGRERIRLTTASAVSALLILGSFLLLSFKGMAPGKWVLDAESCSACGKCQTYCVRSHSAVRAVIDPLVCPGTETCPAYEKRGEILCPTGAFQRVKNDDGTYTVSIDQSKCVGCGKCVRGCRKCEQAVILTITDNCLDCNDCLIEKECPKGSIQYKKRGDN